MANKKKPRPKAPRAVQTEEGVNVVYEGRVLPPSLPPIRKKRHCPQCGHGPVGSFARYGSTDDKYLFRCPKCVDPETCRPTKWQEPR